MATTSAIAHVTEIRRLWGSSITGWPATVIRKIAGTNTWSQHAYGNGVDFKGHRLTLNVMAAWSAPIAPPDRLGRGEQWVRTPEGQPRGEIEHSWEGTLRALTPMAKSAAGSAHWAARIIRSHISR